MPNARYGHIVVVGTDDDLSLAAKAYAGQMRGPVGDMLDKDFTVEFHSNAEFRAADYLVPSGRTAFGHVAPKGVLWINRDKRQVDQIYALRHEPFHPLISANMTEAKRAQLLPMVERVPDASRYQNRLNEVLCDAFVELFWGKGSILDAYYGDIADENQQKALDILMRVDGSTPEPEEPAEPLPLPSPDVAALIAQRDAANAAAQAAAESHQRLLDACTTFLNVLDPAVGALVAKIGEEHTGETTGSPTGAGSAAA